MKLRDLIKRLWTDQPEPANEIHVQNAERWRTKAMSNLKVILLLQEQRDSWRNAFYEQGQKHLTAQGMLVKQIEATSRVCRAAINQLNELRKEKDLPPITKPTDILNEGEHLRYIRDYAAIIKNIHDNMPQPLDLDMVAGETIAELVKDM